MSHERPTGKLRPLGWGAVTFTELNANRRCGFETTLTPCNSKIRSQMKAISCIVANSWRSSIAETRPTA